MKSRFDDFLVEYQEDLRKIVGKHISQNASSTVDDMVGQVNFNLIKTKQKFFDKLGYDFSKADFTKWAYAYARNVTNWQGIKEFHYSKNLADGTYETDDGQVSLFDWICDQIGVEEDVAFFDEGAKLKVIVDIIKKYSHILTEIEKDTFGMMLKGKSEKEIATKHSITRQAVNICKIRIFEKLRHHYKGMTVEDENKNDISEANESAKYLAGIFNKADKCRIKQIKKTSRLPKEINLNKNHYVPE
jgi:DNA-binding CsgD family transcriptional regulator